MRRLLALGLLGLCVTGCASQGMQRVLTPNDRLRDEVRELERLVVELQRKATVSEVEIGRLKERVVELEVDRERLENQLSSRPAPSPPPPTRALSEEPLPSVRRPARIESEDLEPEPLPAPVVEEREPAPVVAPSPATERAAPSETSEVTAAGQAIYDQGYTQYHRGQYVDAEASFLRFLEGFPNTDLSDNAQFWIGEARFARGDHRGALAAFREVIDRFASGNKVPDALVKAGLALEEMGDIAGARRSYEEVMRRFSDSPAALRAEERVADLGG